MRHPSPSRRARLGALLAAAPLALGLSLALPAGPATAATPTVEPFISEGPASPETTGSPSFTFSVDDDNSEFLECGYVTAPATVPTYATCQSPKTFTNVPAGSHTFYVRSVGSEGERGPAAFYQWTSTSSAPEPNTILTGLVDSPVAGSGTWSFIATDTVGGSQVNDATFECRIDSADWAPCTSPATLTGISNGLHTFFVRATRNGVTDQTPAQQIFTSASAPDTTITQGPVLSTTATSASFSFESSAFGSTFECSLDEGPFESCTSPKSYSNLGLGDHSFAVRATASDLTDPTPDTYDWTITEQQQSGAPDTIITEAPTQVTSETEAYFGLASLPGGTNTFYCWLDDEDPTTQCFQAAYYFDLEPGTYTFHAAAFNASGTDPTPATYTWTITGDQPPAEGPRTRITGLGGRVFQTDTIRPVFSSPGTPDATFLCALDKAPLEPCKARGTVFKNMKPGKHTLRAVAVFDGVQDPTPAVRKIVVDVDPPESRLIDVRGRTFKGGVVTGTLMTPANDGDFFECRLDGGKWTKCSQQLPLKRGAKADLRLTGITPGVHELEVRAVDLVGNRDPSPARGFFTMVR
ncbi:hypothetical protein [Nocardioides sp.]|uniref:hypothetical protein n=1 Tax=Nocardioides sp. TaxID=35761 RepID=UPI003512EF40